MISMRNTAPLNSQALFWIYISIFLISLSLGAYNPLIPLYAQQLGASYFDLGLIGSAWALPYVFLPVSIGLLSQKINKQLIFFIGIGSSAINAALFPLAQNVSHLIAIRIFGGVAYALMWPTIETIISDITTTEARAKAMGRYSFSWGIGFLIGPAVGGLILEKSNFNVLFLISFITGLFATAVAIQCLRTPSVKKEVENTKVNFSKRALASIYLAIASYSLALGIVFSLFPAYASFKGITSLEIGILFAVLGLVRVAIFLQSEAISKVGEKKAILLALLTQAIVLPILPYLSSFPGLLFGMALLGLALGVLSPISIAAVSKMIPREKIGVAIGAVEASFGIGWTLGPIVGGVAAQNLSGESPYIIAGLISLFVAIPISREILKHKYG
jgi:DHA1 family multidrug resistance protein-like MFS transporter/DHA1 family quinolone resistance protein-like MFS transporter